MQSATEKRLSILVLALVLLFHAFALSGELTATRLDHNDSLDHFSFVKRMVQAMEHGGNPLDWFTETPFGYPVIRDYQPFAHMLVALLYFALGRMAPLVSVFALVRYLAMVLLPLTFFVAARWMELPRVTALATAVLAPLVATASLYGIEYESYTWQGYGLFAQAVAVNLLLLSLGLAFRAIHRGRPMILAGLLLGLTFITQFLYGYIGALTIVLMALLPGRGVTRLTRIARTAAIGAVALIVSAFQLLTLALDSRVIAPTFLGESWKADSYGAAAVLKALFTGQVLDHGRVPVLSLLALAGIAAIAWRYWRTRRIAPAEALAMWGALLWTLVWFGRPAWGSALRVLGITPDFPLHRIVGAVQIFLVLLAGAGLAAICTAIAHRWNKAAAAAAALLLLAPAIIERAQYLNGSSQARIEYTAAIGAEQANLDAVLAAVKERGGYAYAGRPSWQAFRIGGWELYLYLIANGVPQISFSNHLTELPWSMITFFNDVEPAHYRLFHVRSAILPPLKSAPPAFLTPRLEAGRFHVYDAPGGGYFDVVDAVASVAADRHSFFDIDRRWIESPLVAGRAHLLLDFFGHAPASLPRMALGDPLPQNPHPEPPGEISGERRSGDIFEADFTASRAAYALFRMTWHQNWKATLDGRPAPTYMLSPGFIGVPVEAGTHRLAFRYRPDGWRVTLALGGLVLALLLVAAEQFLGLRFGSQKNGRDRGQQVTGPKG